MQMREWVHVGDAVQFYFQEFPVEAQVVEVCSTELAKCRFKKQQQQKTTEI